jgi:hypothetical protein
MSLLLTVISNTTDNELIITTFQQPIHNFGVRGILLKNFLEFINKEKCDETRRQH